MRISKDDDGNRKGKVPNRYNTALFKLGFAAQDYNLK